MNIFHGGRQGECESVVLTKLDPFCHLIPRSHLFDFDSHPSKKHDDNIGAWVGYGKPRSQLRTFSRTDPILLKGHHLCHGSGFSTGSGTVLCEDTFSLFGFVMPRFNLPPMSTLYNCVFCLSLASLVLGQASSSDQINHGMDMNMDMGMSLASGSMLPYLHFAASDILWFEGWVPQNKGAIGGACVGLFMLALFDRWLSAIRSTAETHWAQEYVISRRWSIPLIHIVTAHGSSWLTISTPAVKPPLYPVYRRCEWLLRSLPPTTLAAV